MTRLLAVSLILFTSLEALAISCDNPRSDYDETYCAASEMVQLDQTLNEQYGKTIKSLTKEQASIVKKTQIRWIRNRDSECSSSGSINVDCVNKKMKKRISSLYQIERECKASGCYIDLLNKD